MALPVLVVTPSPGFGELISQILHETGGYECMLARSGKDALARAKTHPVGLCILDGDLNESLEKIVGALRKQKDDMLLVIIPPEGDEKVSDFSELHADGVLPKPFYLPDLITTVERVIRDFPPQVRPKVDTGSLRDEDLPKEPPKPDTIPAWLQDVNAAAQHLARMSLESASQASLITRGDRIWAYAGELPQAAVEELARAVGQHWSGGGSDLARFVHLEATGGDYMMYATELGGSFVLVMVFDNETPFSKIRSQASNLATRLSTMPPEGPAATEPQKTIFDGDDDGELLPMQPLLDDVPPPIPGDWIPENLTGAAREPFLTELLKDSPAVPGFSKETSPALRRADADLETEVDGAMTTPSRIPDYAADTMASQPDADTGFFAATVPSKSGKPQEEAVRLEPISPAMVNLTYSCVLIPRLPEHFLTGDLGGRVSEWVTQLCLAFGWRLEQLSVRPEALQWMVNVPPQTSPGYLMRIIRQHTSRRLFVEFPRFADSNPSGDFWAPGYLIMSGPQAPPPQLVKDFIKETRIRQGISK